MPKVIIPGKTIFRFSIYHRCLCRLLENDLQTVSSTTLAKAAGVNPAQLRRDLNHLGQFGTRGLGYPVEELQEALSQALGRENLQPVILVGAGNLGSALLRYQGFLKEGFEVVAAFDAFPELVVKRDFEIPVHHSDEIPEIIQRDGIRLAILCVPSEHAQEAANDLVEAGIEGILSFSPVVLQVPETVTVNRVDLAMELEQLSFFVKRDDV